ncbi:MAG: hypothetical protein AAF799_16530 [Myxococcota bacterium]
MLAALLAALVTAPAPAPTEATAEAAPEAESDTARTVLSRGYLRATGTSRDELVEALVLRVPHLKFEPFEAATDPTSDGLAAFVELHLESEPSESEAVFFGLTIVISDGRAFDRRIEARPDDEETSRLLASTTANLLIAIEAGTVEPDRGDVPIPVAEPVCPACECPDPVQCPAPAPASEPEPEPEPAPPPRIELGIVAYPSSVLGLGLPEQADRFAAATGTLGLHGRLRNGAFFGAELRTGGRRELAGGALLRLRAAVGGGYHLRRGAWSLGASAWATVEPWWFQGADLDPAPVPLFGLAARLRPALVVPRVADRPLTLTMGPVFELAGSAMFDGRPEVGLITVAEDGADLSNTRVGGFELTMGFSATLWFGLPRGDAPR